MLLGQTLMADQGDGDNTVVYSPWFPRQGNDFTSNAEVLYISANTELEITAESKHTEQTDADTLATHGVISFTAAGTQSAQNTNVRELVRFKVELSCSATGAFGECHFRLLAPMWQASGSQGVAG